ncbi:hypothetical protein [Rouxiella aceris]|uniref:hypothetical protein n=1 Tax=Rouxiella aceris TaxID=2703884 RepID=UPI001B7D7240|nr:hypothetical protein [Rouxiella aceris]
MHSSVSNITVSTLDMLMQDTWLLTLAARNGQSITIDDALYQRCFVMIKQVQERLLAIGAFSTFREKHPLRPRDNDISDTSYWGKHDTSWISVSRPNGWLTSSEETLGKTFPINFRK